MKVEISRLVNHELVGKLERQHGVHKCLEARCALGLILLRTSIVILTL